MRRISAVIFAVAIMLCAIVLGAQGTQSGQQPGTKIKSETFQPLVSLDGRDNFLAYCAACHGVNGRGDGPAVPALKVPVPDLTTMARRSSKFDSVATERFISGVDKVPAAHGSSTMPIWGPAFRSQGEHTAVLRLRNLVKYLENIQGPRT